MFQIIRRSSPIGEDNFFTVKANFVLQVSTPFDPEWMNSEIAFKTATFSFAWNCRISSQVVVSSAFPIGTLLGMELRKHFIGTFGHQYSSETIERALRYMAETFNDSNFTIGLLHKPVSASENNKYEFSYASGGALTSKPKRNDFSQRAHSFSLRVAFMQKVKHPVTGEAHSLRGVIMNLNDGHGWTREQIADWLETLDIDINMKPKEEVNV